MKAGHDLDEDSPAGVAAQRAYFNFLLLGGIENESQPTITLNVPTAISCEPSEVSTSNSGGTPPYSPFGPTTVAEAFQIRTIPTPPLPRRK